MTIDSALDVNRLLRSAGWLDGAGKVFQDALERVFEGTGPTGMKVRSFLNGTWLGHPLHAALTDVPLGLWTGGVILDAIGLLAGDRSARRAADWCVGIGCGGAVAAAVAGMADFSKTEDPQRREATAHSILNGLALAAFGFSFYRRRRGDWAGSLPYSAIGYALALAGADIGGRMVYNLGTLVSREAWQSPPREFTTVFASEDLTNGQMRKVESNGMSILLARVNGQVLAIGNTCTHWGCSLAEGQLAGGKVTCPCHGSVFDLKNGLAVQGPASEPEPFFDVREQSGQIQIKLAANSVE